MTLYLAYGSNLNVEQMARRCPGAVPVGRVFLPDHRLVCRGSGSGFYLSVDPVNGETVECVAWLLGEDHEDALDWYEGYPHFYGKQTAVLPVKSLDGKTSFGLVPCMWYALPTKHPLGAPSPEYFRACKAGYQYFGIPVKKLVAAVQYKFSPEGVSK